jgi:hypothetical protein
MTAKTATRMLLAFGLVCASVAAQADCRDDFAVLKARLAAANQKAPNVVAAKKEMAKADEEQQDELSCSNAVERAWRAYRAPAPPVAAQQ